MAVGGLAVTGERNQKDVLAIFIGSNFSGQFIPVERGQTDVDEGHVGMLIFDHLDPLEPVAGNFDAVPANSSSVLSIDRTSALSPIIRMLSGPSLRVTVGNCRFVGSDFERGRRTTNSLPFPLPALSARTDPPCNRAQSVDDRQSETQPPLGPIERRLQLHKRLEHRLEHFGREADAVVSNANHDIALVDLGGQLDGIVGLRILRGVRQEIHKDLLQADGVSVDRNLRGRGLDHQFLPRGIDLRTHDIHCISDHAAEIETFLAELNFATRRRETSTRSSSNRET